jgi:membrane protein insertase Oxa1/YidC/SpoIIIJ
LRQRRSGPAGQAGAPGGAGRGTEEADVWPDLAALTPPLVMCLAVLVGVAMLLRSQMSPKRRAEREKRRRPPDQR